MELADSNMKVQYTCGCHVRSYLVYLTPTRGQISYKLKIMWSKIAGADLAFFQGGGGLTQRRCRASSTSREAASRFFLAILNPRK